MANVCLLSFDAVDDRLSNLKVRDLERRGGGDVGFVGTVEEGGGEKGMGKGRRKRKRKRKRKMKRKRKRKSMVQLRVIN